MELQHMLQRFDIENQQRREQRRTRQERVNGRRMLIHASVQGYVDQINRSIQDDLYDNNHTDVTTQSTASSSGS
eukprot:12654324-Prorocentrum_lima.AAC.1